MWEVKFQVDKKKMVSILLLLAINKSFDNWVFSALILVVTDELERIRNISLVWQISHKGYGKITTQPHTIPKESHTT